MIKKIINRLLSPAGLQIKRTNSGFWTEDQDFLKLYSEIKNRTLVKVDRCYMLYQFAKSVANSDAAAAQLGVYKGGTAKMIAKCFPEKKFYLFDTFSGLPNKDNLFNDVNLEEVKKFFSDCKNVKLIKGFFPKTAEGLGLGKFCFVYLDADLYESTIDALNFFYPKMIAGGVILLDDYKTKNWPGIEKAVSEFSKKHKIAPIRTTYWQGLIIKN